MEGLPSSGIGVDALGDDEKLITECVYQLRVGGEGDGAQGRKGECVQVVAGLEEQVEDGRQFCFWQRREAGDIWECWRHDMSFRALLLQLGYEVFATQWIYLFSSPRLFAAFYT